MKLRHAAVISAALLALIILIPERVRNTSSVGRDGEVTSDGMGALELLRGEGSDEPSRSEITAHERSSSTDPSPSSDRKRGPLLRIVDPQGAPIAGARGGWVGRDLVVIALEFDENGIAERPVLASGHAFVLADGYLGRGVLLEEASEGTADPVITLRPWYVLHGVVRLDGAPPGDPLLFTRLVSSVQYGGTAEFTRIWRQLVALGVPPYSLAVPVEPDGSFDLIVEWELELVPLHSPGDLRVQAVNGAPSKYGDRWAAADAGVTSIEIDVSRVPAVVGRLVWDDGEPAAGESLALYSMSAAMDHPSGSYETTDADGAFAMSVKGTSATLRTVGRRLSKDLPLELDLVGAVFPIDLGDVEILRPTLLGVEVVGLRAGVERPVVAMVASGIASGWTDEDGRVSLAFDPDRAIEVLAEGYRSHRGTPPLDGTPLRVVLEAGADLTVLVDRELTDTGSNGRIFLRLTFDRSPFDSAIAPGSPDARCLATGLYQAFQINRPLAWGFDITDASVPGAIRFGSLGHDPLVIPGLVPGAELRVELMDLLGAVLSSRRVVAEAAGVTVRFESAKIDVVTLTIEPRWIDGARIEEGRVRISRPSGGSQARYIHLPEDNLVLGPIAPCVVEITTEVPGARNIKLRDVQVGPNGEPVSIVLERDR